jgi:hypothetical protein
MAPVFRVTSTLSPSDIDDWPPEELVLDRFDLGLSSSAPPWAPVPMRWDATVPAPIGHNGPPADSHPSLENRKPSFGAVVAEALRGGLYVAQRDILIRAIRDPQLGERHRVVLTEIIIRTSTTTGAAFPGYKGLAAATGYSEPTVELTVTQLLKWGYLASIRKAPESGGRALAHYAVIKPTEEELQAAITAHILALRKGKSDPNPPIRNKPDPNPSVRDADHNSTVRNSRPVPNSPWPKPGSVPNPVVPPVTSSTVTGSDTAASCEAAPATKVKAKKKRSSLQADWRPNDALIAWVKAGWVVTDQKIAEELEKFRAYHDAKGSLMANWDQAWRTWWLNGFQKCVRRPKPGPVLNLEDEVQRLAETDDGRALLAEKGLEEGMAELRALVVKTRERRPQ